MALKATRLKLGDTIGIVSPASPTAKHCPRRLKRGIEALQRMGLHVELSPTAIGAHGHVTGKPEDRARDINEFFRRKDIKAIIATIGGFNSNHLLDLLDYKAIKKNPKIFLGYSDITALHCAIHSRTGLVTFYGPAVLPHFGEQGGPHKYTLDSLKKMLLHAKAPGRVRPSRKWTEELRWWDKEDHEKRPLTRKTTWKVVKHGVAEGKLIGGNLDTLLVLTGTKYLPNLNNAILFLEDEGQDVQKTDRALTHLEQSGIMKKVRGIIYGRPYHFKDGKERTLYHLLKDLGHKYNIPVMADMDFGHTDPIFTIPYGVKARINTREKKFEILESAVK